jgi:hypothetical protein
MLLNSLTSNVLLFATMLVLWQGSSCGKSNKVSTSTGNVNVSTPTTNVNSSTEQPQKQRKLAMGIWGGEHVSMEVTEEGAKLEFDCAHGSIDGQLAFDENGKVTLKGRFKKERGGPIRQGEDQSGEPATFTGTTDGKTLELKITLDGNNEDMGTFTLTHGKQGRVRKCL